MNDTSFSPICYAVLTKGDPNLQTEERTSSYCCLSFKNLHPFSNQNQPILKVFSTTHMAIKTFGHA